MLEEKVEEYLRQRITALGGECVKLNPKGYKGIPDRLVLLPGGRVIFVELKRPKGGVVARLQSWWRDRLRDLGFGAHVVATRAAVDELLSGAGSS